MSKVIDFAPRKPSGPKSGVPVAVSFEAGGPIVYYDSVDDAIGAMRDELLKGRGFAATVRRRPPDETEPEHAQ